MNTVLTLQGECFEQPATDGCRASMWHIQHRSPFASVYRKQHFQGRCFQSTCPPLAYAHITTKAVDLLWINAVQKSQLMLDEQPWAGGHFYLFVKFSRGSRIRNYRSASLSCGQTCSWGLRPRLNLCLFLVSNAGVEFCFSTRELSPPLLMWHALRRWRGWLAWDEHEQQSAFDAGVSRVTCGH